MKPLVSLLLCQVAIQFFITQAENDNNKGKRQITDRTDSRAFFKRKRFLKIIFERRTCTFHSVCSDEITALHCKNVLSWNWRIYTYNSSFNVL
jgi:thioredoxin-related protein